MEITQQKISAKAMREMQEEDNTGVIKEKKQKLIAYVLKNR